jgi:hypothetical protein
MGVLRDMLASLLVNESPAARLVSVGALGRMGFSGPMPADPEEILEEFVELACMLGLTDEAWRKAVGMTVKEWRNGACVRFGGVTFGTGIDSLRAALVAKLKAANPGAKVRSKPTRDGVKVRAVQARKYTQKDIDGWVMAVCTSNMDAYKDWKMEDLQREIYFKYGHLPHRNTLTRNATYRSFFGLSPLERGRGKRT